MPTLMFKRCNTETRPVCGAVTKTQKAFNCRRRQQRENPLYIKKIAGRTCIWRWDLCSRSYSTICVNAVDISQNLQHETILIHLTLILLMASFILIKNFMLISPPCSIVFKASRSEQWFRKHWGQQGAALNPNSVSNRWLSMNYYKNKKSTAAEDSAIKLWGLVYAKHTAGAEKTVQRRHIRFCFF